MRNYNVCVDRYQLVADKHSIFGKKKFLNVCDLHIGKESLSRSGLTILRNLEDYLCRQEGVTAILVPGDLVNGSKSYLNSKYMEQLREVLSLCGAIAPTILSKGNHDLYFGNLETGSRFLELGNIRNVFPLDNDQLELGNVVYTGFSPRSKAYKLLQHGKNVESFFIEDFDNANFHFDSSKVNVMLCHSPHQIKSQRFLTSQVAEPMLSAVDYIASGHLHNGYIPNQVESLLNGKLKDFGVWENCKTGFVIDCCRGGYLIGSDGNSSCYLPQRGEVQKIKFGGEREIQKTSLVVSKGIAKYLWAIPSSPCITEVTLENSGPVLVK